MKVEQPPHILEALKAYSRNPRGFLVMAGKNGTGKTFAANAIISHLGYNERFHDSDDRKIISQASLNIAWQHQLKEWGDTLYLLNQLNRVAILCLDDVGTRDPTPAFMDFLYAMIDHRWEHRDRLATIITTNLNSKQMREKFGDAFTSRVTSGKIIRFEGIDRRLNEF